MTAMSDPTCKVDPLPKGPYLLAKMASTGG